MPKVSHKGRRIKGSKFERDICKQLSAWWGGEFKRTPMSGGWGQAKTCGDVIQMDDSRPFPFSVECKHQEGWNFDQFMQDGKRSQFARFLQQCWKASEKMQAVPMLIAKRNGWKDPVVVLPAKLHISILPVAMFYFIDSQGTTRLVSCYKLSSLLAIPPEEVEKALEQ